MEDLEFKCKNLVFQWGILGLNGELSCSMENEGFEWGTWRIKGFSGK